MDKDITLEQEFDLVFKAHYSLVKNFALMLLKSGQDADDIAQDVFTRLWAKPQIWQDNPGIDKYIKTLGQSDRRKNKFLTCQHTSSRLPEE